ncbi:MAG: hypothetical protein DI551_05590 [Micavibrio aeruginosavorus]|uniref:Filamentous haemagglutinin FhaB/tRNA nuclease CdiA-like TPS domain-containing protein n=1 Tax=Micavibrio aeruginosavorus TaxID=349221 RepID=A0A2W5MXX3_9BACT|nr:MAG: hypothetical protein DI551_05590 [Micavibrio aeruginosavorus]
MWHAFALDDNALPTGGNVVGGSATIGQSGNNLNIHQNTDRVVINWDRFDIGKNATTTFYQPGSGSIAVNRVTGSGDPTKILGTLRANGTVVVLDRNGVIFGQDSVVDVGGIIASTGDIDDGAFMSGSDHLEIFDANTGGQIINNGSITVSEAGLAAFVAPTVVNNGLIQANMGRVALASGDKATVDLYGDGLVELATDVKLDDAKITNSGTIKAHGGTVLMTASAAKEIVDAVINVSGLVDVSSASVKGGKIVLEGANTEVSGTLDASGATGGGEIYVGGDYQGKGTIRNAAFVNVKDTAVIKANTTGTSGDGGKVIVWADDSTHMDGTIEAKGGSESGDGGFVETSGKINLGVLGSVDAGANNDVGKGGEWLLDPSNVIIMGTGGNSIPGTGGTVNPPSDDYQIDASSIQRTTATALRSPLPEADRKKEISPPAEPSISIKTPGRIQH